LRSTQAKDSKLEKTFVKVAEKMREKSRFGHVSNAEVLKKAAQKEDTMVLYRPKILANKFESDVLVYDGAIDKEEMQKWVAKN